MIELKEYVRRIKKNNNIESFYKGNDFERLFVTFMTDNDWFDCEPSKNNESFYVDEAKLDQFIPRIIDYFQNCNNPIEDKCARLMHKYMEKMPQSYQIVNSYFQKFEIPFDNRYYIIDFLLVRQEIEFNKMNDENISPLVKLAVFELTKANGDIFCMMLSWFKQFYHMHWFRDYTMTQRRVSENGAYDIEEYLELLYYLFNEDYINENEMYKKAASDKNYADTWLYMCMHFMRAIRNPDLQRIGHPELTMSPQEVLTKVLNDSFPDEDARITVFSITWRLAVLPLNPRKTERFQGVPSIKLTIPESLEVHMGKLLAICESHFLISGQEKDVPLIRIIGDYERINRYMGEDIGVLFLMSNFRSRGIHKSYLQGIYMLSDEILDDDSDEFNVKGYILAALARSHKGSFAEFAQTTVVYLKDAKFSGLTPEFVARELFERGVLSLVPSMLMKILTNNSFNKLSIKDQTRILKELNISPYEAEKAVRLVETTRDNTSEAIKSMLLEDEISPDKILMILHRIGGGYAVSKCDELLCVMTAMKKNCPYADRRSCFGCKYEIGTKSVIFAMVSEYKRLLKISKESTSELERNKSIHIINTVVLPLLKEVLTCLQDNYGEDAYKAYERIVKENL